MTKDPQTPPKSQRPTGQNPILYCDGACSGNPGPGGWGSIVLTHEGAVQELGGFDAQTTNNRMELTAAIEGLNALVRLDGKTMERRPIDLFTDSVYVIRGMTEWINGWRYRGWTNSQGEAVANKDLWEELSETVKRHNLHVKWLYVPGHKGIPGNERADAIAVAFSKRSSPSLFQGPFAQYDYDLTGYVSMGLPERTSKGPTKNGSSAGAYYISYVDRQLEKHTSWKDCEARVKGRPGAKFKKIQSPAEEAEFLKKWGIL
jgi:ribonuclease HI